MSKGKFIVLEGIDGSGKSTQILKIAYNILGKSKYNHILLTREPYKKEEIRAILREDSDPYSQAKKLAELFVQDRKEHAKEFIIPNLEKGIHVISDRYKLSTIAYQSAQGIPVQELIDMHANLPIPDITIIVDLPAERAAERMSRDNRNEHKFEADVQFQEKTRQNYLKLQKVLSNEKIRIVDGTKSIEELTKDIIKIIDEII